MTIVNGYIQLPVTTDPATIQQQALAQLATTLPGWVPRESHIEVLLLEQFSAMVAESAQVAAQVPLAIFAYFGSLVGIPPNPGTAATARTTWTMVDNRGYTVPAGTIVGYQVLGNQLYSFQTTAAFTVPNGSNATGAGEVTISAQIIGSTYNGLATGLLSLVTALSYVQTVVSTTVSAGGVDPESQSTYLNRLSAELQLMAPRPIIPSDFANLAPNVPGVTRATAINLLYPGRTVPDMLLTNTSPNISASDAAFTPDDVGRSITGAHIPGSTSILTVTDATHAVMSHNASAGATEAVVLGDLTHAERAVSVAAVDAAGAAIGSGVKTELQEYLDSLREVNFVVSIIDPTFHEIDVTYNVTAVPNANTTTVQNTINAAVNSYLSPAVWGGGLNSPPTWNAADNVVRYLSLATLIGEQAGVDHITSLTLGIHGGGLSSADVNLTGYAPLPYPGTITSTVVAS